MNYIVDNAIIMAAGLSSRFVPISQEKPKALIEVKGEILIERQIKQLKEVGVNEIYIVVGYKKEEFRYLENKFNVILIENTEYEKRNNHSSVYAVKDHLKNSYLCSADNYFKDNPFTKENGSAYYASEFVSGNTKEWCLSIDDYDNIVDVKVGGKDSWIMLGHVFFDRSFSEKFVEILTKLYDDPSTNDKLWEQIYMENIKVLSMKIKKYNQGFIYEFDSLDELREFDQSYVNHSNSWIMESISKLLKCEEKDILNLLPIKKDGLTCAMEFMVKNIKYTYDFTSNKVEGVN